MNILHLNQHLAAKGGVETYLLAALPLLRDHGFQSTWLYAEGDEKLWSNSKPFPALAKLKATDSEQQALQAVIEEVGADIVHIHNIQNADLLQASTAVRPTIITNHDYRWLCPANNFFYKQGQEVCSKKCGDLGCFATTLTKRCLTPRPNYAIPYYRRVTQMQKHHKRISQIIAPSPTASNRLLNAGWERQNISVLPYFCPLEALDTPRPIPEKPTITYMGRIAPNKGQEYFVKTLGLLSADWQGILVGNLTQQNEKNLRNLANQHHCHDRIRMQPWAGRKEIAKILEKTTVLVFPSLWEETLGIVAIEALSQGVPVIASDITGISAWLDNTPFGRIVSPKDTRGFATAIQSLAQNEKQLIKAGEEGIALIRHEFSPDHHIQQLAQIYQRALK